MARSCPASVSSGGGVVSRVYKIYIPYKDNSKRRIRPGIIQHLADKITNKFSGSTSYEGTGCYFSSESGKMECEPVKIVEATRTYGLSGIPNACDEWIDDDNFMDALSRDIAEMFGQEGVFSLAMSTDTIYVAGEKRPKAQPELIMPQDLDLDFSV